MILPISRSHSPAPRMDVIARYRFEWVDGEFKQVDLSKRYVNDNDNDRQFDKDEDIPLGDVPDDAIEAAREELHTMSLSLSEAVE